MHRTAVRVGILLLANVALGGAAWGQNSGSPTLNWDIADATTPVVAVEEEVVAPVEQETLEIEAEPAWEDRPSFWARVFSSECQTGELGWFFQADLLLLNRVSPGPRTIGVDISAGAGQSLNASNADFHIAPGMRLTLGDHMYRDALNRDHTWELSFMGLTDWEAAQGLNSADPNNLFTPLDPGFATQPFLAATIGGFNTADTYRTLHTSDLYSFELMHRVRYRLGRDRMVLGPNGTWKRQLAPGPTPSFFWGVRYMAVNEHYRWRARRNNLNFNDFGGNYDLSTTNNLLGFQLGGDWRRQEDGYSYGAQIKLGGYLNHASLSGRVVSNDTVNPGLQELDVWLRGAGEVMSFGAELNFGAEYEITRHSRVRAGVELMWLQGLAIASNNLTFDFTEPSIDLRANAFYMGLSFGYECQW